MTRGNFAQMAQKHGYRATATAVAALMIGAGLPAHASIFEDAGLYPGDTITHTVSGIHSNGPIDPASVTLTIDSLPLSGKLRAFSYVRAGAITPSSVRTESFTDSEYSSGNADGPFQKSTLPVDRSGRFGAEVPIDLGELRVEEVSSVVQGAPIFLVLESPGLNVSSTVRETAVVALDDITTGDNEFVRLHETNARSGVFTGWFNTSGASATTAPDGMMSTTGNSSIKAEVGGEQVIDDLATEVEVALLNPANRIFDARTGSPINGVRVRVVNADTGSIAPAYGIDLISSFPSEIVTGANVKDTSGLSYPLGPGEFRFPHLPAGKYRLMVDVPEGYAGPSVISDSDVSDLGQGYELGIGSRFEDFEVSVGQSMDFDIPLDRAGSGDIVRTSDPAVVEVGDLFRFEVNIDASGMDRVSIKDSLPTPLLYEADSLTINGRKLDVSVEESRNGFFIPELPVGGRKDFVIRYAARVAPSADPRSILHSSSLVRDLDSGRTISAGHDLRLTQAFGIDEVDILGQISVGSCDVASAAERDLSGVRVLLESGKFAITDKEGKFHFSGIPHRPHVVQVDETTLPRHAKLVPCNKTTRSAGSARSQFVDMRPGMMARVDFTLEFDEAAMEREDALARADRAFEDEKPLAKHDQAWVDAQPALDGPRVLSPDVDHIAQKGIVDVEILRRPAESTRVLVNGVEANPIFRDPTLLSASGAVALDQFRALRIREGRNQVEIIVTNSDGVESLHEVRRVGLATSATEATLMSRSSVLESDGRTQPTLRYKLTGQDGVPLAAGTHVQIAVESPFGLMPLEGRDSRRASEMAPQDMITTVVRDNGEVEFRLAPVMEPGVAKITIHAGVDPIDTEVQLEAAERPWVLVGLAEGTIAEQQVRERMRRGGNLENDLTGRVSLFAEGVIKGKWLLSLRFDTERDGKGEFDGIDPEKDYIVYGDQSWQGDAAPSRYPLYLRLRKEEAEVLVGDFDLDIDTGLIKETRKVTGMRALRETENFRVLGFAAETTQRYVQDSIAVDGTVGPYRLSRRDIVAKSETVRLVTLSRIDADEEISSEDLRAGQDYVVSYTTGEIVLRRPIPAFDEAMRRHVLRIGYETDEDVVSGMVAGIRAEAEVSERTRVGGTLLHERNSEGMDVDVTIVGLDIKYEWSDALTLSAEVVQTYKDAGNQSVHGTSGEIRGEYDDGENLMSAYLRRQSGNGRLNADLSTERVETLGVEFSTLIDAPTAADHDEYLRQKKDRDGDYIEGNYLEERQHENDQTSRRGEALFVRRRNGVSNAIGFSGYEEISGDRSRRSSFLTQQASWKVDRITYGLGVDYAISTNEQDVRDRMLFSLDYELDDRTGIFMAWDGGHSRESGELSGLYSAGYRIGDDKAGDFNIGFAHARAGDQSGSSVFAGGQKQIAINKHLTTTFGVDAQRDLGADEVPVGQLYGDDIIDESFVTARSGMRWTEEGWSAGIDAEYRWAQTSDHGNIRISADGEITENWSLGGDGLIGQEVKGKTTDRDVALRFSAAYRAGPGARIDLLGLEYRAERTSGDKEQKLYLSWNRHQPLSAKTDVTLRYSMKFQALGDAAGWSDAITHMTGFELRHDISEKFDIGLHAAAMSAPDANGKSLSAGISLGFSPVENSWISAGYNFAGFGEEQFSKSGETGKGAFVQLRMKFDQNMLKDLFR